MIQKAEEEKDVFISEVETEEYDLPKEKSNFSLRIQKFLILTIYFLIPVFISIIYWYEDPVAFSWDMADLGMKLIHNFASILGIFSYIWMCFNILIITRVKVIENKFTVNSIIKFHTIMATIALLFACLHAPLLLLTGVFPDNILNTGLIGLFLFLGLMILAIIFMTNRLIKSKGIRKLRLFAFKKRLNYDINKILHNITMLAVFFIFIHTLIAFTADSSLIMRATYFGFFVITLIGWVSHKIVRGLHLDPAVARRDPFAKGSIRSRITQKSNKEWLLKIIEEIPSLYACFQCGTCSDGCPVALVSDGKYNPRIIMEEIVLGQEDMLINKQEPNVWLCSTCQKCVENCPQGIEVTEVFTTIKNECFKSGTCPDSFIMQTKMVYENGLAIPFTKPILRRREQLGLPEIKVADIDELQQLMKAADLDVSKLEEEAKE